VPDDPRPPLRSAAFWLAALGAVYALFCVSLFRAGVPGRAVLLPIAPDRYYAWQAVFVGPLLGLLATIYAWLAWRLAGGSTPRSSFREAWSELVPRYAGWTLFGFVLPDLAVFLVAGPGALAPAMRYYGAVAPIGIVLSSIAPLGRLSGARWPRALVSALGALIVQALLGAPLLR
jgi:hypothetical protein